VKSPQKHGLWSLAVVASLFCAPTILGGLALTAVEVLRPGNRMPLETPLDRALVDVHVVAVPVALLGLPFAAVGVVAAGFVAWKLGRKSAVATALLVVIALSLVMGARIVTKVLQARAKYPSMFRR
jgi:hypothetical protein